MTLRRPLIVGAVTTALCAGAAIALPAGAATPAAPRFSRPLVLVGGGAEPSIRVPGDGKATAYVSAPAALGSNFWVISQRHNRNGSVTFKQSPVQQPDLGTGGGDSEISVGRTPDPKTGCDAIAYSGLHNIDLLDNFTTASSTDCGKTFTFANVYATQNTLTDRQWQTFDGQKTNFLIFHKVDTGQIVVSESPDAGAHYVSLGASGANGVISPALLAQSGTQQQIGNVVTNYAEPVQGARNVFTNEPIHAMYAVFGIADSAATGLAANSPASNYNGIDSIWIGKSVDGGATWKDTEVFHVNPKSHRELNMLFPVVTVDRVGNVYAAWADTYKVEYAVSTDHGAHWSKPFQVNRDNRHSGAYGADRPDAGKADVFPWIAAGAPGMLDVVWYHGQGGAPRSNRVYRDPGDAKTKWTVAFAQLKNATHRRAGHAAPSVVSYSDAITPVIHTGDVCQNGTFCSLVPVPGAPYSTGDRSLLDFFQVAIDRAGRAELAIADNADAPGQYITAFVEQLSGYSLTTGRKLATLRVSYPKVNCKPDATFTDPSGDANEVLVSTPAPSAPALDIVRGYVTWNAPRRTITFHAVVKDLSQDPPAGSNGMAFDYNFGFQGKGYDLFGTHDSTGNTADIESPERTTVSNDVKLDVDKKHNEIRFTMPANALAKIKASDKRAGVITGGARITGLAVTSRREDAVIVPNADEAAGVCAFSVPKRGSVSTVAVPGGPGGGDTGWLPSAPVAAVHGVHRLVTGLAIAVLLGLAAGTASRRRVLRHA